MFCRQCGSQMPEGTRFCTNCGAAMQPANAGAVVNAGMQPMPVQKKKFGLKKIILFSSIAVIAVVAGFLIFGGGSALKLGKTKNEVSAKVPTGGSVIKIEDANSGVNGLVLTVEPGAYDTEKTFDIKTTEIKGHKLGSGFTPITPLITIDNGHEFANKPMKVTIPIQIAANEFALGFYYDRTTGQLEAIPFDSIGTDQITLLTSHFSEIVVSKIAVSELEKLTTSGSAKADSGFEPGKDDWQFTNYGSALAPGGHCAGQSLTMSWYYSQKYQKESEPRLYGLFDNNGEAKTSDFWEDDSDAYRFASVVQYSLDWDSQEFHDYMTFSATDQKMVFYAFAYAIQLTKQPQFMGIYTYNEQGGKAGGHAIVAYKVENGRIYVADPNYPGQADRYCELGQNGFQPYSSGANAADITENGAVLYTEMHFIGSSALIDYDAIEQSYEQMLAGTVGKEEFPQTKIEIMTKYGTDISSLVWAEADGSVALGKDYIDSLPENLKNLCMVRVTPLADNMVYTLYLGGSTDPELNPVYNVYDNSLYYEVALEQGENEVAFLIEVENNGSYSYVDFVRIPIQYGESIPTATPAPTQKQSGNSLLAQVPGEYELTYIGGVGAPGSEHTSIVAATYYLYADGTYTFYEEMSDTDPVNASGTWTLTGNKLNIAGIDYIFNGSNITMDSEYAWIYTKK